MQDESILLRTGTNGRNLWSHVVDPVTVSRHGRRDRTVVFGAFAEDVTGLMRQYERFDGATDPNSWSARLPRGFHLVTPEKPFAGRTGAKGVAS